MDHRNDHVIYYYVGWVGMDHRNTPQDGMDGWMEALRVCLRVRQ